MLCQSTPHDLLGPLFLELQCPNEVAETLLVIDVAVLKGFITFIGIIQNVRYSYKNGPII
ncbi:hypothetical protein CG436_15300 [Pantoea ananatis]|nr:hypothetical protein CG436_15300 [Pantoea ananatis]